MPESLERSRFAVLGSLMQVINTFTTIFTIKIQKHIEDHIRPRIAASDQDKAQTLQLIVFQVWRERHQGREKIQIPGRSREYISVLLSVYCQCWWLRLSAQFHHVYINMSQPAQEPELKTSTVMDHHTGMCQGGTTPNRLRYKGSAWYCMVLHFEPW